MYISFVFFLFFFFKQKTAYEMRMSDWSSDVCSSDLDPGTRREQGHDHMSAIRTILLAEDSPNDAEMAIDALRDAHLVNPIVHVEDGVEALDYLLRRGRFADRPEGDPAVLLLDIKMPRMDGLEVLTQLRQHDHLKRLPVVILSSSREENDLARSWDLGVNAYVVKPVDVDQFFEAVKTLGKFWAVFNEAPQDL